MRGGGLLLLLWQGSICSSFGATCLPDSLEIHSPPPWNDETLSSHNKNWPHCRIQSALVYKKVQLRHVLCLSSTPALLLPLPPLQKTLNSFIRLFFVDKAKVICQTRDFQNGSTKRTFGESNVLARSFGNEEKTLLHGPFTLTAAVLWSYSSSLFRLHRLRLSTPEGSRWRGRSHSTRA